MSKKRIHPAVVIRMSPAQKKAMEALAAKDGLPTSTWARRALMSMVDAMGQLPPDAPRVKDRIR